MKTSILFSKNEPNFCRLRRIRSVVRIKEVLELYFIVRNTLNNSTLIPLQYEAKDLSGNTSDEFGTCDVTQKLDQMEMQITKKNCQKSKNNNRQRDNYTENFLDNGNVSRKNEIRTENIYVRQTN